MILAIDPGSAESAYVLLNEKLKPVEFGKVENEILLGNLVGTISVHLVDTVAVEMIASYGMSVGKEVFETCVWIGKFLENTRRTVRNQRLIYRKDAKMNLCHSMKAKDSNITQALVDRFATGQPNHGKGTKKEKGWFHGFSKDIWQAYAVGVTYADLYLKGEQDGKSI